MELETLAQARGRDFASECRARPCAKLYGLLALIDVKPRRGASVVIATSAQLETLFGAMSELEGGFYGDGVASALEYDVQIATG